MVNKLSDLADFLNQDPLPAWLKQELAQHQENIAAALGQGHSFDLNGPGGERVTISPKAEATIA